MKIIILISNAIKYIFSWLKESFRILIYIAFAAF